MFLGRQPGTNRQGGTFTPAEIEAVWAKAQIIVGENPSRRRLDSCGAIIDRDQYGVTKDGGTGWEIDHIIPVSRSGSDALANLQPLQWQNNRYKSDKPPGLDNCLYFAKQ